MAGRRLLDAAKLLNASRSVARQHLKLRSDQFDVFTKTSTLARVAKQQTDRVTLTARAAVVLARRFNEPPPSYTSYSANDTRPGTQDERIPRDHTVFGEKGSTLVREGLEQDHHWERSHENATNDRLPQEDLDITQEKAKRNPLPDGTIPPGDSSLHRPPKGKDTYSQRPIVEPPKDPLAEQDRKTTPKEENIQPVSSGSSTIPTPVRSTPLSPQEARRVQWQSEKHIPAFAAEQVTRSLADKSLLQGHDEDIFYSRSSKKEPDYSSLPRVKIPKNTRQEQGSTAASDINADVFHKASVTAQAAEEVPEDVDLGVFRTSRVAHMLGGRTHSRAKEEVGGGEEQQGLKATKAGAISSQRTQDEMRAFATDLAKDAEAAQRIPAEEPDAKQAYQLRESRVPSTRFGRLWQYGGLATSMAFGAVGESFRRITGSGTDGSLMLSPGNMERLVAKLSRMRGAALKLGQMISFQDIKMLPAPIHEVLQRVQDSADYMPASQRNKVLAANLGTDWEKLFTSFDDVPIAAASIGQVHRATLASNNREVAVKVQYPGVADSIDSDLSNLSILLTASKLLPKGLYLDKTIANARTELAWECDYLREAECQTRFQSLLADDTKTYTVPTVYPEASGAQVLTAELMRGKAVTKHPSLTQAQRDWIGTQILRLCLREIVEFRFMQTDPNWTNFLYNAQTQKLELLDFGASRDFPQKFVDPYVNILINASENNREAVRDLSIELGYLTGHESTKMLNAHIDSILTLAEPFSASGPDIYDFRNQTITDRVREFIPIMVRERLAPPPEETYSLHRKLSGAFLLCARLGSRIACKELFERAIATYHSRK